MLSRFHSRSLLTLLFALVAALVCKWLRTPLPWMIGPLVATAVASMLGAPVRSWVPLRNAGQWVIGAALGLYFTPQVTALVASLWWAVLLGIAWALLLGWGFATWLERLNAHGFPGVTPHAMRSTCWFAGAIGAASEMTLLAERVGARPDLVAASHSLRVLIVTLVIPFGLQWSGLHGLDAMPPALRNVELPGLLLLALLTGVGALLMKRTGRANPWFVGALMVAVGLTMSGVSLSAIPQWLTNAAQLVIAVSLGVRFTPDFVHTAPRWLASVAAGTLVLILLCAGYAWVLSLGVGLHPATVLLATAPGGIAEMSITAKVLALGVPVVTAFQVCRLVAVLLLVEPIYRRFIGRADKGGGRG